MEISILICLFLVFHAYFGYPLSLWIYSLFHKEKFYVDETFEPTVSFILTFCNEAKWVESKIRNIMEMDYPKDKIEIICVSDASTDNTYQLLEEQSKYPNVKVFSVAVRSGKETAQKLGIQHAKNFIHIFTDVSNTSEPDLIRKIVRHYADPNVGAVGGRSQLKNVPGEGLYLKYENWIRQLEQNTGNLVGFSGCLFSCRKEVSSDFATNQQSDFRTALMALKYYFKTKIDPEAVVYVLDVKNKDGEFGRKIRTVVRGINVLKNQSYMLNPFEYRLFSYQLFCHKVLKWSVPVLLILAYILIFVNFFLTGSMIMYYAITTITLIMVLTSLGLITKNNISIVKILSFLFVSNTAILSALYLYFIKGERMVSWKVSDR